ncbi:MAG TPA: hypothetical protein VIH81_13430 [Roseiarcus sp.]
MRDFNSAIRFITDALMQALERSEFGVELGDGIGDDTDLRHVKTVALNNTLRCAAQGEGREKPTPLIGGQLEDQLDDASRVRCIWYDCPGPENCDGFVRTGIPCSPPSRTISFLAFFDMLKKG